MALSGVEEPRRGEEGIHAGRWTGVESKSLSRERKVWISEP